MLRALIYLTSAALLAACNSTERVAPAQGACAPTCAGREAPSFAGYQEARDAFTRQSEDEVILATLEDAAWLRYEGTPDEVAKKHAAYFDYGYTTFEVVLRSKEFTQPTKEVFLLEDSSGKRVSSKPLTYKGQLKPVGDRWTYTFSISFQHTITSDVRWLKLTRVADGSIVEWTFPGA